MFIFHIFMLLNFYTNFILSISFDNLSTVTKSDFYDPSTFMIYVYYNRPDQDCPLCKKFNEKISELPIPIKKINFFTEPFLASHLYIFEFPTFIIRHKLKSYVIRATTVDELFNVVENNKWVNLKPFYALFNPTTYFTKIYAYFYFLFYYFIEYLSDYIEKVPSCVVNGILTFIICYLVISIVNIFKNK